MTADVQNKNTYLRERGAAAGYLVVQPSKKSKSSEADEINPQPVLPMITMSQTSPSTEKKGKKDDKPQGVKEKDPLVEGESNRSWYVSGWFLVALWIGADALADAGKLV